MFQPFPKMSNAISASNIAPSHLHIYVRNCCVLQIIQAHTECSVESEVVLCWGLFRSHLGQGHFCVIANVLLSWQENRGRVLDSRHVQLPLRVNLLFVLNWLWLRWYKIQVLSVIGPCSGSQNWNWLASVVWGWCKSDHYWDKTEIGLGGLGMVPIRSLLSQFRLGILSRT